MAGGVRRSKPTEIVIEIANPIVVRARETKFEKMLWRRVGEEKLNDICIDFR